MKDVYWTDVYRAIEKEAIAYCHLTGAGRLRSSEQRELALYIIRPPANRVNGQPTRYNRDECHESV